MYPSIIHLAAGMYFSGDAMFVTLCVGIAIGIAAMTFGSHKDGGRAR